MAEVGGGGSVAESGARLAEEWRKCGGRHEKSGGRVGSGERLRKIGGRVTKKQRKQGGRVAEEWRKSGGRVAEDWRRSGGGLAEEWRMSYG